MDAISNSTRLLLYVHQWTRAIHGLKTKVNCYLVRMPQNTLLVGDVSMQVGTGN